ncbi:twin-arginine translocase TatA/TatE family subunit [bacterium]|nr:twin-arginine translocase TatA/TatE family subunit [bacterium]
MFGPIGGPEMLVIFGILLLLFGAKKLPQLARGVGKSMGEFKKARSEFEDEIRKGAEDLDIEEAAKKSDIDVKDAPGKEPRDS